jgi:GH141 insertion domain/Right handed beta helix region
MALQHIDHTELSRHQRFRKTALFGLAGLCFVLVSLQASGGSSPSVPKSTQSRAGKGENVLFDGIRQELDSVPNVLTQLTMSNLTNSARNPNFNVGDRWHLELTGATPNKSVFFSFRKDSQNLGVSGPYGQPTDQQGRWSLEGIFDTAVIGTWEGIVIIGDINSTEQSQPILFSVSPGLTITNLTDATRNPNFRLGDRWGLTVTGASANKAVFLSLKKDGQNLGVSGPYGQPTDQQGRWSLEGSFDSSTIGTWEEIAIIGASNSTEQSRPISFLASLAPSGCVPAPGSVTTSFYVATNGNDFNPGTLDAPFATVSRAQQAERTIAGAMISDIIVYLRDGRYELPSTLRFTGQDSGTNGHSVIYASYPGEHGEISGGRTITGWTPIGNGIYRAKVGDLNFRQLYVNGVRAINARSPNTGRYQIQSFDNTNKQVLVNSSDFPKLIRPQDADVVFTQGWVQNIFNVTGISQSGSYYVLSMPQGEGDQMWYWANRLFGGFQTHYYIIENALELLDTPGEWYLNRGTGELYYMPRAGEDLSTALVTVPALETLIDLQSASNIQFVGITFEDSNWLVPAIEGLVVEQANHVRYTDKGPYAAGAITLQGASNISFVRNTFRNTGGDSVQLWSSTQRVSFLGNVFKDLAGGAIDLDSGPGSTISNVTIIDNYFVRGGRDYWGSVPIMELGTTQSFSMEHNEIADMPYSGTNFYSPTNKVIHANKVHNVMKEANDGAGLYTSGGNGGTWAENYIYNVRKAPYADYPLTASGIYLDGESTGITLKNNVVEQADYDYNFANAGPGNTFSNFYSTNCIYNCKPAGTTYINDGTLDINAVKANAGVEPGYADILSEMPSTKYSCP